MQIRLFNQIFMLRWWLVLITLAAFLLLIKLAWWQWQRSAEKEAQLQQIQSWQQQGPLSWPDAYQKSSAEIDGAPLQGVAHWLAPFVWLIDNQIWQGKAGYDVLVPVQLSHNTPVLLVNLGWVAAPAERSQLPQINVPAEFVLDGVLRTKMAALRLGQNLEDNGRWPMRMQTIEPQTLEAQLGQPLFNGVFYQRQTPFIHHYKAVVLPPEKHRAYAVQWLLLAIAVVIVAMAASYQKDA
ncbi:SURF1 family protein [Rheinheimera sp. 4Y26]|uniref:SURF1 family protein n=1 Tax=Rheinheimera sp. 4Y26 TaxID=2977811 RepID=UPI0021B13289|nr:SURF1 family protein [Rheinheimera sp. 4Y26]MCT6700991.1 SURF1 family protein [Rheinheimera sp. 4Y26]